MRFFIRISNESFKKEVSKWVDENLCIAPPFSDADKNELKISHGAKNTYVRFSIVESTKNFSERKVLDSYMTNLLVDYTHKYSKLFTKYDKCWCEYKQQQKDMEVMTKATTVPKFILHKKNKKA